jgi:cation transport regulator ChaC
MEKIKKLIPRCYSTTDLIFAGHPNEIESAQEILNTALKEDLGFEDYLNLHIEYLKSKGVTDEHLEEQEERLKDLSTYFQND